MFINPTFRYDTQTALRVFGWPPYSVWYAALYRLLDYHQCHGLLIKYRDAVQWDYEQRVRPDTACRELMEKEGLRGMDPGF